MDTSIIGLMTYFFTGLAISMTIYIFIFLKNKKRDKEVIKEAEYFSNSESIDYERDIKTKGKDDEKIFKKDIYEYDLKFHEIGNFFGNIHIRFFKFFAKNIESIGSERSDLVNILYLSENDKLYITTGFTDPKHDSIQFRAGVDLRLGFDENIQQAIQTPKGETGFYFFDYANDSNIKLESGVMDKSIKVKLNELKQKRTMIRKNANFKIVQTMTSGQRNTMLIFGIGCVGIGFVMNTIITAVF